MHAASTVSAVASLSSQVSRSTVVAERAATTVTAPSNLKNPQNHKKLFKSKPSCTAIPTTKAQSQTTLGLDQKRSVASRFSSAVYAKKSQASAPSSKEAKMSSKPVARSTLASSCSSSSLASAASLTSTQIKKASSVSCLKCPFGVAPPKSSRFTTSTHYTGGSSVPKTGTSKSKVMRKAAAAHAKPVRQVCEYIRF